MSEPDRGGGDTIRQPRSFTYTDMFKELCPYYMSLGMTHEQYWDGDVWMVRDFRKAHKLKLEEQNRHAYIQGMYVYSAIASMVPVLRPFSKARKPENYLDGPIDFYGFRKEHQENKPVKKKVDEQKQSDNKAKQLMEIWAINFNQKFEERQREKAKESEGKEVSENGG